MRVLLDINVLLDVYLNRAEFVADSVEVLRAHREARLDVLLSAVSLPTIFYVVRRHAGIDRARLAVAESLVSFEIVPVGRSTLETARTFPGPDFEDNLQVACAVEGAFGCHRYTKPLRLRRQSRTRTPSRPDPRSNPRAVSCRLGGQGSVDLPF